MLAQGTSGTFDSSYSIIANNIVKNVGKVGIHIQQGWASKQIIVNGNYVERCGESGSTHTGILAQETDDCIITNNIVRDCMGTGIRVNSSTFHNTVNGIVSNNICFNNGRGLSANELFRHGIGIDAGAGSTTSNITVMGNRCYDSQSSGTQKQGIRVVNGVDVVVKDNDVRGNALASGIANVTSTNTTIFGNEGYTTEIEGSNVVADGGTVSHGLVTTPAKVLLTGTTTRPELMSCSARNTSTFTVNIKTLSGTAGTTQTVFWRASV